MAWVRRRVPVVQLDAPLPAVSDKTNQEDLVRSRIGDSEGDHMRFEDFDRKIFQDYDDHTNKTGGPSVGILGDRLPIISPGADSAGQCVSCGNPMYMTRTVLFCPQCRRQHTFEAPDSEYRSESSGGEAFFKERAPNDGPQIPHPRTLLTPS